MDLENNKLVSVVLATFNGGRYLSEQLQSILNQDHKELEIIICDDASIDNTKEIIEAFAAKDSRIRYHINEKNLGVNRNFELGFSMARAQFIAIADQDDIWKPEKISEQMKLFDAPDVLVVHSGSVIFTDQPPLDKSRITSFAPMTGSDTRRLLLRNSISGHNIIFRRSLLEHILPIPPAVYYDWWLCVVATCLGKIAATDKVLAFQRKHDSNVTVQKRVTKMQTRKEYEERRNALEAFIQIKDMKPAVKAFAIELLAQLRTLENQEYSASYFRFLMKNASVLFFYKRKIFPFFSYFKTARRMSHAVKTD